MGRGGSHCHAHEIEGSKAVKLGSTVLKGAKEGIVLGLLLRGEEGSLKLSRGGGRGLTLLFASSSRFVSGLLRLGLFYSGSLELPPPSHATCIAECLRSLRSCV